MKVKGLGRHKECDEKTLSSCLNEFFNSETSFTQTVRSIKALFHSLKNSFPAIEIFDKYDHLLKTALPSFENLYSQSQSIASDETLIVDQKVQRIAGLYCDEMYYRHLTRLIFLLPEFEGWGGEAEYARCLKEVRLFPSESVENGAYIYSPSVFLRQLFQLEYFIEQFSFYSPSSQVDALEAIVTKIKKEVMTRFNRGDVTAEINRLFSQQNGEDHRRAVQIFIEERLYLDRSLSDISEKVCQCYPSYFKSLILAFFRGVEEVKQGFIERPSRSLGKLNTELKERLKNLLEYSKEQYQLPLADFSSLELMAKLVLSEKVLNYSELQADLDQMSDDTRLSLLKCFSDYSHYLKDHEKNARDPNR